MCNNAQKNTMFSRLEQFLFITMWGPTVLEIPLFGFALSRVQKNTRNMSSLMLQRGF